MVNMFTLKFHSATDRTVHNAEPALGKITGFTFSTGICLNGGDITVTFAEAPLLTSHAEMKIFCRVLDDNNNVVAWGLETRRNYNLETHEQTLVFSGVPSLLRGSYITSFMLTDGSAETIGYTDDIGGLCYNLFGNTVPDLISNILEQAQINKGLAFPWIGTGAASQSTYRYNVNYGDIVNLAQVIEELLENKWEKPFRFTYENTPVFNGVQTNLAKISNTNSNVIQLPTKSITKISELNIDKSETAQRSCGNVKVSINDSEQLLVGSAYNTIYYTGGSVSSSSTIVKKIDIEDGSVTSAQELSNVLLHSGKLPAQKLTVTLKQISSQSVFDPLHVGRIVSMPIIHRTSNKAGSAAFLHGLVSEAKYESNDSVELTLSNVAITSSNEPPFSKMSIQSSTPLTVTNLLNSYYTRSSSNITIPKR